MSDKSSTSPNSGQVEVQIMGQSYLLSSPPGAEQSLLAAVEKVDSTMRQIRDAGKVKARDRIAVLTSVNLAYQLNQANSNAAATASNAAITSEMHLHSADAQRIGELIHRLDHALEQDGQLL